MAPQRGEKRTLTPEAFGQFLRWLSRDDELAVQEYQQIRTKLIRFFIHKGCTDADDLFDKTVDIVVAKVEISEGCHNPLAYCYGVARNVWHEDTRERKSVPLEVDVASPEHPDARPHEQELQCSRSLPGSIIARRPRRRNPLSRPARGRQDSSRLRGLADGAGGMNALRIRVCRIRKELRICVVECTKRLLN